MAASHPLSRTSAKFENNVQVVKLLDNALMFAKQFVTINKDSTNTVSSSIIAENLSFLTGTVPGLRTIAHFSMSPWACRTQPRYELVGLFMLNLIAPLVGKSNVGLYRDNGLAILENVSDPDSKRFTKKIIKLFQQVRLNISAETNLVQTDFLTSRLI